MRTLLILSSSAAGEASKSRELALLFAQRLQQARGEIRIIDRCLGPDTPHYSMALFTGLQKPAGARSADEASAVAFSESCCAELVAADLILIASPMYALTIPSTLKAWFEYVNRRGIAFEVTPEGPKGLLGGKVALLICTRGSSFPADGALDDLQLPVLHGILDHYGIKERHVVLAESLAHKDAAAASLTDARAQLEGLAAKL